MADITVTVPAAHLTLALDAFADTFGWDSGGAETKADFAKRMLAEWVRGVVVNYRRGQLDTTRSDALTALAQADVATIEQLKTDIGDIV